MMLIVILAFVMLMKEGRTKYEKQDYFKQPTGRRSPQERWQQPKDDSSGSYSSRWDRQNNDQSQTAPARMQRNVKIFLISLAIVGIVFSFSPESLLGFFIFSAFRVIISFLRI